jgi:hypothetical protein
MALTKFDIASAALVTIGAEPVASFDGTSTEAIACQHLYQGVIDGLLSVYPWRFASRTVQLSRDATIPGTQWRASYTVPFDMKAVQAVMTDVNGTPIPFDRFENRIWCDASETQSVWCTYTYEPPIAWWPGYFVALAEITFATRLAFSIAGKLDLREKLDAAAEKAYAIARHADAKQQTTRKFRVSGRRSIMEARRA